MLEADINLAVSAVEAAIVESWKLPPAVSADGAGAACASHAGRPDDEDGRRHPAQDPGGEHSADFADVATREFVMGIYQPALVLRGDSPGEFNLVVNLHAAGSPIMFVVKQDVELPTGAGRVTAVKTGFSKKVAGGGESIAKRIADGRLVYADMGTAQAAVTGNFATLDNFTDRPEQFGEPPSNLAANRSMPKSKTGFKPLHRNYAGWGQQFCS